MCLSNHVSWLSCTRLLGQGQILLPNGSVLQHGPHHPHQVMGGGYQGDLPTLRVTSLGALEERVDGRRTAHSDRNRSAHLRASVATHRRDFEAPRSRFYNHCSTSSFGVPWCSRGAVRGAVAR